MNKFLIKALCVLSIAVIQFNNYAGEDWITEEVLKQLTEVRQELKLLRGEVSTLTKEVSNLKLSGGAKAQNVVSTVELGDLPRLGSKDSSIVIVEFSEFQCPYCVRHFKQTMPLIVSNYIDTNKVQYVSRDFPLGFHAKAKGAATATRCAAKQSDEAYWGMHDQLFTGGSAGLSTENYKKIASDLKLNAKKFAACLDDPEIAKRIDADSVYGQQVGVSGTPAFFIGKLENGKLVNAKRLTGAQPYSAFARVIDSFLK